MVRERAEGAEDGMARVTLTRLALEKRDIFKSERLLLSEKREISSRESCALKRRAIPQKQTHSLKRRAMPKGHTTASIKTRYIVQHSTGRTKPLQYHAVPPQHHHHHQLPIFVCVRRRVYQRLLASTPPITSPARATEEVSNGCCRIGRRTRAFLPPLLLDLCLCHTLAFARDQ